MKNKNKLKRCLDYLRNNKEKIADNYANVYPSSKEKILLTYLKEFRNKLAEKHNAKFCEFFIDEYGVKRNICSSIIQIFFPFDKGNDYKEIYTLIRSQFTYEILLKKEIKTLLLANVSLVFDWKIADCSDLSTIVVSSLRTKNYDAYVVCGEAPFSICSKDDKKILCEFNFKEFIKSKEKNQDARSTLDIKGKKAKYRELMNIGKRSKESKFEDDEPENKKDRYIHMWVLIKKSLDVKKDVFIEMCSGREYDVDNCPYTSIFYLWNEKNVYVNIHKTEDIATLISELRNKEYFVPAFYEEIKNKVLTPIIENKIYQIRKDRLLLKYPQGRNTSFYKNCKKDEYSVFLQHDGLTEMHTHYENKYYTNVEYICCLYTCRRDGKRAKIYFPHKFKSTEYYDNYNHHFLKALKENIGFYSHFSFYPNRPDGLTHYVEIKDLKLMEYFTNRNDQVIYRSVKISPTVQTTYKLQMFNRKEYYATKITIKYGNKEIKNGIKKKIFLIPENKIILMYYNNCNEISNTFEVYEKSIRYNHDMEKNEEVVTYKKNFIYKHFVNYADPIQKDTLYLLKEERDLFDDIRDTYNNVIGSIRKERIEVKQAEEDYQYKPHNITNINEIIYHDNNQIESFNKNLIEDKINVCNFYETYPWDKYEEVSMSNSFFSSKRNMLKIECSCDEIEYVTSQRKQALARVPHCEAVKKNKGNKKLQS
ncbi:hypothetical protein, conserved [Plasmodium gonderi]|uniref:Dynein regulatory complex subunit 7 MORN domain-containing protein n=1 Tax=Plasmodium gonderi TaxID=77519 RepID=A0A1Y1JQB6_PLAGO|nr:hypothetical protein, conserved [Plasmodium gonderi]GAW83675.1 hypothetical protein, conserved [Plasmodium gonderi]